MGQQFAVGLAPREAGGRVTGWTIKPGADLLPLAQAGLQPGDVLLAVNGEAVLDREQIAGCRRRSPTAPGSNSNSSAAVSACAGRWK
jgi:membrane-associated protease RseP (regulator of RpoE activity)